MWRSAPIRVSATELSSLLNRTFEALFARTRDYEDAARVTLWLQSAGQAGIASLCEILPAMSADSTLQTQLQNQCADGCEVHVHGASLLCLSGSLADLAIAGARANGRYLLTIRAGNHPTALLPAVARCGALGLAAAALWRDVGSEETHVARIRAGHTTPALETYPQSRCAPSDPEDIRLLCARDDTTLDEWLADETAGAGLPIRTITTDEFHARQNDSLTNGIRIEDDHYGSLSLLAQRILVAASEQSRRGAGD